MALPMNINMHVLVERNLPDALGEARALREELVNKLAQNCIEIASLELMTMMGEAISVARTRALGSSQSQG